MDDTKKVTLVRRRPNQARGTRAAPWDAQTVALTVAVAMTAAFAATSVGLLIAVAGPTAPAAIAARR